MSEEEVIWKPVLDFEGLYEVSSVGEVRHVKRLENFLKPRPNRGYLQYKLSRNGKTHSKDRHRLMCEAFHGPQPGPEYLAAHKNDNKDDNRLENIYWATPKQNYADAVRNGRIKRASGIQHGDLHHNVKILEDWIPHIRKKYQSGASLESIADLYDVDASTIFYTLFKRKPEARV